MPEATVGYWSGLPGERRLATRCVTFRGGSQLDPPSLLQGFQGSERLQLVTRGTNILPWYHL